MKTITRSILIGLITGSAMLMAGSVTIPNTFKANTPAKASEVNANFTAVKTAVDGNANDIATNASSITTNQSDIATKQNRVSGTCAVGSSVREINADGTVVCETAIVPGGYGTIIAGGHTWLDRNLGATRAASSLTDHHGYGDLYQWGRSADGHQIIRWTSATTAFAAYGTTTTTADNPTTSEFIKGSDDWRITHSDTLWDDSSSGGVNNVCPLGYRVPTRQEFTDVGILNAQDAFDKLRLVAAGDRYNGSLYNTGVSGYYWTLDTYDDEGAYLLKLDDSSAVLSHGVKSAGMSIRCIKAE